jgi:hypothetical protein
LVTAFALSLILHVLIFGGWQWAKAHGLFSTQATWLIWHKKKPVPLAPTPPPQVAVQEEIPLTFVEVDPAAALEQAPPDTKFYGAHNAVAANEEPNLDTEQPKADGKQTEIPKTADVQKPLPFPLQPSEPPPAPEAKPAESKPAEIAQANPSALTAAKAEPVLSPPAEKPRPRPRTLQEARNQLNLAGEKVKQDGGTRRRATLSFNVKATEFGAYDHAFIAAVQERWYNLLDSASFVQHAGKVVLEFRLTYDGRITDMRVAENEVGEILSLLCQRAVMDPAPYAAWPSDMRRKMGNYRDVRFTFYYN